MTRLCGRPTQRGSTCCQRLLWYETACVGHATEAELSDATDRLRQFTAHQRIHEYCPCPCHAVVQAGLVPCPRCDR